MQPQGTSLINASYYADMTAAINSARTCAELQQLTTQIFNSLKAEVLATNAQIVNLAPFAALVTPPASPTAAVTWISNFITAFVTPQYAAYVNYASQLALTMIAIADLTTAINNKASTFTSCTITPPTIP